MTEAPPVRGDAFAAQMARIGDFEAEPLLAVAVSGGADSMALALLARDWATARGGRVVALTVDHRLRTGSGDEAAAVGRALSARGVAHEVLTWDGPRPASGVEEAARAARYGLLIARCRALGALHLLTAHHAADQAETVLLRLSRGSGPDGLAGMALTRNLGDVRLLRPLLDTTPDRLRATCAAAGLSWFEDPTNQTEANARGRLRRLAPLMEAEGLSVATLNQTAARAAAQRRLLDGLTARLLARTVALSPYGFAVVDGEALARSEPEMLFRALGGVLAVVGGGEHPPRREGVERLAARLRRGEKSATTLAGCVIRRRDDGRLVICRELSQVQTPILLAPGAGARWDNRFFVTLSPAAPQSARVGARGFGAGRIDGVPAAAGAAAPAIIADSPEFQASSKWLVARFIPPHPLIGAPFPVVSRDRDII